MTKEELSVLEDIRDSLADSTRHQNEVLSSIAVSLSTISIALKRLACYAAAENMTFAEEHEGALDEAFDDELDTIDTLSHHASLNIP